MGHKYRKAGDATERQIVLEVPDREGLVSVLQTVADDDIPAQTVDITPATLSEATSVTVDLDILTDKQREALTLALEEGYYDRPRDASLTELASRLDISKSAVSQRIRGAERKLIESALDPYV